MNISWKTNPYEQMDDWGCFPTPQGGGFLGAPKPMVFVRHSLGRWQADEGLGIGVPLCSILVQVGKRFQPRPHSTVVFFKKRKEGLAKKHGHRCVCQSFLLGDVCFFCLFVF